MLIEFLRRMNKMFSLIKVDRLEYYKLEWKQCKNNS
jgi:hypothetical protein